LEDPIDRDIDGITASGGTNIAPALAEAVRSILPIKTATKHIILFTDGRSEDIDSLTLARRAALRHVTISTVGLGARENRRYLETVARWAGGESYVITDPLEVERTIVRDTIARSRFIELGTDHWPAPIRDPAGR
jgi:Mg-chelatase subunit ChlD